MNPYFKRISQYILVGGFCPLLTFIWIFSCSELPAEEPVSSQNELPRIHATEVGNVMSTFEVRDGFILDLVASEPLVVDPVAMSFDEWGRAFVVEMRGYSERRHERLGRIKLLVDTDQDGSFDHSTVYAKDLPWPTAVICYDGGIFIGATPDIYYLKDTDGDGAADIRTLVFTGFASDSAPYRNDQLNMQAMLNSFHWGPDNRIHGATGLAGGKVYSPIRPDQPVLNLRGKDFSFDPITLDLRAESGGAQNGMSFDTTGRKYVCSNSDHLQFIVYDEAFAGMNPFIKPKRARVSIAEDGPAAPVYRISPDEPWRIVRTKWRVAGAVRGPVEGGGTPSGYFTGATGATLFTGDAWGGEFLNNAFIADCGSNLIHRKLVHPKGHIVTARRPDDELTTEFVRSSDNWFRPVQFSNGPDGNLYILDMYREVIEHPWSLPEGIKRFLDLNSGNERGRIFRVRRSDSQLVQQTFPGQEKPSGLVKMLGHSNHWHRVTARRLIIERDMHSLGNSIRALLRRSNFIPAKVNAIQALSGLKALTKEDLDYALKSDSSELKRACLTIVSKRNELGKFETSLMKHLSNLISNDDTRFQAVLLLSKFPQSTSKQVELIWQALSDERKDKYWMQFAALNAMYDCSLEFFNRMVSEGEIGDELFHEIDEFYEFLGASLAPQDIARVFKFLTGKNVSHTILDALNALSHGIRLQKMEWALVLPKATLEKTRNRFFNWLENHSIDQPVLGEKVITVLGVITDETVKEKWRTILTLQDWAILHPAVLASLSPNLSSNDLEWVLKQWNSWGPSTRQVALETILSRDDLLVNFMRAAQKDPSYVSNLTFPQRKKLIDHRSEKVSEIAAQLMGDSLRQDNTFSSDDFQKAFLLDADLENGQKIFNERCTSCHRGNGQGFPLGPDLISVKTSGKNRILDSILLPNKEVQPQFVAYEIETLNGENFVGLITEETRNTLVIKQASGITHILQRQDISALTGMGKSIMPEGLLSGMSHQDVGDLLEYIVRLRR